MAILCQAVVSIGLFCSLFVCFGTMEYVRSYQSFLLMTSQTVKKVPMQIESCISLGGTNGPSVQSKNIRQQHTPLYEKDTKQNQSKPILFVNVLGYPWGNKELLLSLSYLHCCGELYNNEQQYLLEVFKRCFQPSSVYIY